MVKHCPQLGSTWPRSVHFWKVKMTYFPVICQYLTLIWQQKKSIWHGPRAHRCLRFLSASSDGALSETISFRSRTDSAWLSKLISMRVWRLSVVVMISMRIWRTAVHWQKKRASLAGLEVLHDAPLVSLLSELSIIYINEWSKNHLSIYQRCNVRRAKCAAL